jgi:hypothetical protein
MICSQHPTITYSNLVGIRKLLERSERWCPDPLNGYDNRLIAAIDIFIGYCGDDIAVGVDLTEYADCQRGFYPEEKWFMQRALRDLKPEFLGTVNAYIQAPERTHDDFVELIDFAMLLCVSEFPFSEDSV